MKKIAIQKRGKPYIPQTIVKRGDRVFLYNALRTATIQYSKINKKNNVKTYIVKRDEYDGYLELSRSEFLSIKEFDYFAECMNNQISKEELKFLNEIHKNKEA